jgi:hypothetical protein
MRTKTEKSRNVITTNYSAAAMCVYGWPRTSIKKSPPAVDRYQFADVFGALLKYARDGSVHYLQHYTFFETDAHIYRN